MYGKSSYTTSRVAFSRQGETLDIKIEALKKHVSQTDTHEVGQWMRESAQEDGKEKGIQCAEAYRVMILQKEEEGK